MTYVSLSCSVKTHRVLINLGLLLSSIEGQISPKTLISQSINFGNKKQRRISVFTMNIIRNKHPCAYWVIFSFRPAQLNGNEVELNQSIC